MTKYGPKLENQKVRKARLFKQLSHSTKKTKSAGLKVIALPSFSQLACQDIPGRAPGVAVEPGVLARKCKAHISRSQTILLERTGLGFVWDI